MRHLGVCHGGKGRDDAEIDWRERGGRDMRAGAGQWFLVMMIVMTRVLSTDNF